MILRAQCDNVYMNNKLPIAFIGDPHACLNELLALVSYFVQNGIPHNRIYVLGDLEDRGPFPALCTRILKILNLNSIQGNHERSLVENARKIESGKSVVFKPGREYKQKSLNALTKEDIETLNNLPRMVHFEDHNMVAVHAGISPYLPLYAQNHLIDEVQLVNKNQPGESYWWGAKTAWKYGKTEEELKNEGWERWYNLHNGNFDVVFGHSVFEDGPLVKEINEQRIFGIDTGCVFGGYLTGLILNSGGIAEFVHVKAQKTYFTEPDFSYDFSNFKPAGKIIR